MPFQLWIRSPRSEARAVKVLLEGGGRLDRSQKIAPAAASGYVLLPTTLSHERESVTSVVQEGILAALGLPRSPEHVLSLVALPARTPEPDGSEGRSNPIATAISTWLSTLSPVSTGAVHPLSAALLAHAPKRWSVYPPMLLLPSHTFQQAPWPAFLAAQRPATREHLWRAILTAVQRREGSVLLTHLAINASIPPFDVPATPPSPAHQHPQEAAAAAAANHLRSPTNLLPLYGDFGPEPSPAAAAADPSEDDFAAACWVAARQNGLVQMWAPRHTMFSRGNVKEKARILGFGRGQGGRSGGGGEGIEEVREGNVDVEKGMGEEEQQSIGDERAGEEPQTMPAQVALDLYAGIGYFAFSYVQLGLRPVLCWEINAWSIEGLRRGAARNGWAVHVVRGGDLRAPLWAILRMAPPDVRLVVLAERNEAAAARISELRRWEAARGERLLGQVVHVNCGLLPRSELSWRGAWEMVTKEGDGWMHLHENVGVQDIERRREEIEEKIRAWAAEEGGASTVEVEHVERVKTFAPGVWHCVFDVHIAPSARTIPAS